MSLYQKASLVQIPSGYKAADDKLYSVVPNNGDGDFTVTVDADATRVNKDGLIESVAADQARLNYDFTNPQDPHLLLEPSRTNTFTYSEDFTNSVWSKQGTSSVSGNTTTAPNGSLTADTLSGATGTDVSGNVLRRNVSGTVDATLSIYVKSLGSTNFTIYVRNGSSGAVQSQSITPNDTWQRVTLTHDPDNGQVFFGNTNGDVAIWGAQLEEGSYATSYIPTSGIAETRTADTCGDAGNSTIIKAEGGLFVDFTTSNTDNFKRISITDASDANNNVFIQLLGTAFAVQVISGGTTLYSWGFTITLSDRHKLALRYKDGDSQLYYNGVQQTATPASGTWFTNGLLDTFSLNQGSFFNFYGEVNQAMVFNEELSNSELQTLTS